MIIIYIMTIFYVYASDGTGAPASNMKSNGAYYIFHAPL